MTTAIMADSNYEETADNSQYMTVPLEFQLMEIIKI
jgi:hypothetical protein